MDYKANLNAIAVRITETEQISHESDLLIGVAKISMTISLYYMPKVMLVCKVHRSENVTRHQAVIVIDCYELSFDVTIMLVGKVL